MISHRHQCIFVHQKKAAGTTVKSLFYDESARGDPEYRNFNDGVLDSRYTLENPVVSKYFKFTVVRNPWDRFVSAWKYLDCTRHRQLDEVLLNLPSLHLLNDVLRPTASMPSRRAYLREWLKKKKRLAKYRVRSLLKSSPPGRRPNSSGEAYRHITLPQANSLFWPDGSLAVDYVIYYENLEEGLREVASKLGIKLDAIPHRNRNPHNQSDYREFFDDSSLEDFEQIYAKDIHVWGYDFETGKRASGAINR